MKQYKRARERKNHLNSLLKETILMSNGSGKVHAGRQIERATPELDREVDGGHQYKPRRNCSEDWGAQAKRESDHGAEEKCFSRLHIENGREHRSRCGNEGEKTEGVNKVCEDFAKCGG